MKLSTPEILAQVESKTVKLQAEATAALERARRSGRETGAGDPRTLLKRTIPQLRRLAWDLTSEAESQAQSLFRSVEAEVSRQLRSFLSRSDLLSLAEIRRLNRRVAQLEKELARVENAARTARIDPPATPRPLASPAEAIERLPEEARKPSGRRKP